MAASQILRDEAREWRVRVVNVTDLISLGIPQKYPHGLEEKQFQRIFPLDCPVIFNFHGYTAAIKQMCWERPQNQRFDVNGYREEGTTTTPFDMHILNRTSRYHLVIQAAEKIAAHFPHVSCAATRQKSGSTAITLKISGWTRRKSPTGNSALEHSGRQFRLEQPQGQLVRSRSEGPGSARLGPGELRGRRS
jgi:phosphoketolase